MTSFNNNHSDYYLDIKKVLKIRNIKKFEMINTYYRDALMCYDQGLNKQADSLFKTLIIGDYLRSYDKDVRDEKLKTLKE
jgi:hypothetical protein